MTRPETPLAMTLHGLIRSAPGGVQRGQLVLAVRSRFNARLVRESLDWLAGLGLASSSKEPTGGRTAERWRAS